MKVKSSTTLADQLVLSLSSTYGSISKARGRGEVSWVARQSLKQVGALDPGRAFKEREEVRSWAGFGSETLNAVVRSTRALKYRAEVMRAYRNHECELKKGREGG